MGEWIAAAIMVAILGIAFAALAAPGATVISIALLIGLGMVLNHLKKGRAKP